MSHASTTPQKLEAEKIGVWCRRDSFLFFFLQNQFFVIGLLVTLSQHQAARPGSASFGSTLPPKQAFGVDETLLFQNK